MGVSVHATQAQRTIHGHVYAGQSSASPADSVKLFTVSGNTAFSDVQGYYTIVVSEKDTLYISYKDREVIRFNVTENTIPNKFDIYLNNPSYFNDKNAHELKQVEVHTKNYHDDSITTRETYKDIFEYERPKMRYGKEWIITPIYVSVNFDALARWFAFKQKNQNSRDKRFALESEDQLYIDSRFTRSLAGRIAHLDDDNELSKFMKWCRPTAPQLRLMNDLELSQYILDQCKDYKKCKVEKETR